MRDCWLLEECDEDREGELEREYGYRRSGGRDKCRVLWMV